MLKILFGGAAAAAIATAGVALAQPTPAAAPAPQAKMHRMDKVTSRDEVVAHIRDMFAKLDTNRDGFVSKEEGEAAHAQMAAARHEKFAKRMADRGNMAFDRLDSNKDGSISRQEFDAGRQHRQEHREMAMQEGGRPGMWRMHRAGMGFGHGRLFEMADANKDGRVTLQEATAAALQHFDSADLNHDGKLTPEERRQAHQQLRGQRQPA